MPTFRAVPSDQPPASELLAAMLAEMAELYGDITRPGMPSATAADFAPPAGGFLVGFEGEEAVCCGGFKPLPDGTCEIKRMYVVPAARGRGLGVVLLRALEDAARAAGYRVARLDTGPRQPGVARMYRAQGYRDIANFNGNLVATYFGEKDLTAEAASDPTGAG
ncbi:GNAT family N-acetyltransferase [Desertihabitans aurantiacus]|uniref:GNAT family N-acetyltransferase n=1 Tax=Desertihabitans aurantiacus TaxID=2282477 RepID=UPI001E33C3B6|nr:GNAT family N-acetyltransferase [Desertihabitans aurantiacus]